ncbi:MAG: hypothetical protein KDA87_23080 [Planctomycetales bacterium]|nr:hypothetical protein [Planctomycetales bacterium]
MNTNSAPKWFGIVAAIALIWNLLGCMAFVMQLLVSEDQLDDLPTAQQELFQNIPNWYFVAFAAAVLGGAGGSLGLLLRKKWAVALFWISLAGVVVQQVYMYLLSDTIRVMGIGAAVMPTLVLIIAIKLLWLSRTATQHEWLK